MKDNRKALTLETRRAMFELVTQFPGLHFREILRRLEMSSSNLAYHLHYLVKNDILTEIQDGKLKRYYVKGKVDQREKRILSILRKEIPRGIVLFLLLNPNTGYHDILDNFDLEPSQLSYYLKKLMDKSIIVQIKQGRTTRYSVIDPDVVANVLISYQPAFLDKLVESFAEAWAGRK